MGPSNMSACFMAGAGHSGSTLLGMMLGAHPDVFYAGEASKSALRRDHRRPPGKSVCRFCGVNCPVWTDLEAKKPGDLFEALAAKTGCGTVVDSSFHTTWVEQHSGALARRGATVRLLCVRRDGRAVLNSRLRKYPAIGAEVHVRAWLRQITLSRSLARSFPGHVAVIGYENLATEPERELRRLSEFLDLAFNPRMLRPWAGRHHPLAGNTGALVTLGGSTASAVAGWEDLNPRSRTYYRSQEREIALDLRWLTELSGSALQTFEELAGDVNKEFEWDPEQRLFSESSLTRRTDTG